MGVYVVTGAASGMGKASADRLREAGHTVIGIDLKDGDVVADLSTAEVARPRSRRRSRRPTVASTVPSSPRGSVRSPPAGNASSPR